MPGELDQISRSIGALEEGQRTAELTRLGLWNEISKLRSDLAEMKDDIAKVAALGTTIAEMKPEVDALKRARERGIGIMVGVGLAGGAAGTGLAALLRKIGLTP